MTHMMAAWFDVYQHPLQGDNPIHPLSINPRLVMFRVTGGAGDYLMGHRVRGRNKCWTGHQRLNTLAY